VVSVERANEAVQARFVANEDFFGGWEPSDIELFARYAQPSQPVPGKITDFMGIRTATFLHSWAAQFDNKVIDQLPLPDDSLRAEAIEYHATFDALEAAAADTFKVAEIGASYAPWVCVCATLARRSGRLNTKFLAVEASAYLYQLIKLHLSENDLDDQMPSMHLIQGAVGRSRGVLYFPIVSSPMENGGQATSDNVEVDYIGRQVGHERVEAYPVSELLGPDIWDLVHIDVQGVEYDVLSAGMETLDTSVRAIFVGTHSRKIEGQLLELFHGNGWQLKRERPTRFRYFPDKPDVVGWTTRDGGQYWVNPRLRD
jgi:FkbM family methyltransferase